MRRLRSGKLESLRAPALSTTGFFVLDRHESQCSLAPRPADLVTAIAHVECPIRRESGQRLLNVHCHRIKLRLRGGPAPCGVHPVNRNGLILFQWLDWAGNDTCWDQRC